MLLVIIDKFEGGYWNNDTTKPKSQKCVKHPDDPMYDNSGETMFGIDRRAGNWDSNPKGREFFELIDNEKENYENIEEFCQTWRWNYNGGSLQSELKSRAGDLMLTVYENNKNAFTPEALEEVESNKRLLFHFAYACWNGSGVFQSFAEDINNAVESGLSGDELVDVAIESRNNRYGGTDWAGRNQEVVDIIKNDSSLEN